MPQNPLGQCYKPKCGGPLCTRSRAEAKESPDGRRTTTLKTEVCCERCGEPQPDHPLARELAEAAAAPTPPAPRDPGPQDYPATVPDRVLALERQIKAQADRIAFLAERVAQLEHAGGGKRK